MKDLEGGVAVVTGGASGIGFGLARALAAARMRLVIADIETDALEDAGRALRDAGADVVTEHVDVAESAAVERLAERAWSAYGGVSVLCNNAGVIENNVATWEYTLDDWNWVLGINVMGVVHGIRAFVPRMIDDGAPGHIVNTASLGGLITSPTNPIYIVSKHAVVALSETLQHDFTARELPLGCSVLCPGFVRTAIASSDRNRANAPVLSGSAARIRERFQQGIDRGLEPEAVGDLVVAAIREDRFYIHTDPALLDIVRARFDAIMDGRAPANQRIPNPKR